MNACLIQVPYMAGDERLRRRPAKCGGVIDQLLWTGRWDLQGAELRFSDVEATEEANQPTFQTIFERSWEKVAGPGEVLVSEAVVDAVDNPGLRFERADAAVLKGIPEPVTLFRVMPATG